MSRLPSHVVPYFRTIDYSESTLPEPLLHKHSTRRGAWARLCVGEGRLRYHVLDGSQPSVVVHAGEHVIIEPHQEHRVELLGPTRFHLEFLRDESSFPSTEHYLARVASQTESASSSGL